MSVLSRSSAVPVAQGRVIVGAGMFLPGYRSLSRPLGKTVTVLSRSSAGRTGGLRGALFLGEAQSEVGAPVGLIFVGLERGRYEAPEPGKKLEDLPREGTRSLVS